MICKRVCGAGTGPDLAEIVLADHPDVTVCRVVVRHGNPADRDQHDKLVSFDGWGSVTAALAALVESRAA